MMVAENFSVYAAAIPQQDFDVSRSALPAPLTRPLRALFIFQCIAVAIAGFQLFVLSSRTADFFAWTINPPVTAAFLGACYWGSLPVVLIAARRSTWREGRIATSGVFIFTCLTTLATIQHNDRFHFDAPDLLPAMAAWAWLAVYISFPILSVATVSWQVQRHGLDRASPGMPLHPALRAGLLALGAILLLTGLSLTFRPGDAASIWPWALTPLTAKACGAWLAGIAAQFIHASWEGDAHRIFPLTAALPLFAALALFAAIRYPDDVEFNSTAGIAYVAVTIAMGTIGALCAFAAKRPRASEPHDSNHGHRIPTSQM